MKEQNFISKRHEEVSKKRDELTTYINNALSEMESTYGVQVGIETTHLRQPVKLNLVVDIKDHRILDTN